MRQLFYYSSYWTNSSDFWESSGYILKLKKISWVHHLMCKTHFIRILQFSNRLLLQHNKDNNDVSKRLRIIIWENLSSRIPEPRHQPQHYADTATSYDVHNWHALPIGIYIYYTLLHSSAWEPKATTHLSNRKVELVAARARERSSRKMPNKRAPELSRFPRDGATRAAWKRGVTAARRHLYCN